MSNVTMSQIAEAAKVSQSTVSFVLNGRQRAGGSISESTAQRVRQVAQELGYRPNRTARALATGKSNLIGLGMWNLERAHYASVTKCVQEELESSQKHLLISCLKSQRSEDDPHLLESIFPWPLDGVITLQADRVLERHWEKFRSWPAPIVNMGRPLLPLENIDSVEVNLEIGVREAIEHLLKIGCRRIAFATPKKAIRKMEFRTRAYADALGQARIPTEYISLTNYDQSRKDARVEVQEYVQKHGCPDGILCFNDEVAIGCYRALRDLGIDIPQQVAIVGCDGIEEIEYLDCPITTIVQPVKEMCHIAWQLLQERSKNPDRPFQQKVLLPQLAMRESTLHFKGEKR